MPQQFATRIWPIRANQFAEHLQKQTIRKRRFVRKMLVHNFCAPQPPPPQPAFPLEFLLEGPQTELQTLSQNCEQTLHKLPTNRIMNKQVFLNNFHSVCAIHANRPKTAIRDFICVRFAFESPKLPLKCEANRDSQIGPETRFAKKKVARFSFSLCAVLLSHGPPRASASLGLVAPNSLPRKSAQGMSSFHRPWWVCSWGFPTVVQVLWGNRSSLSLLAWGSYGLYN